MSETSPQGDSTSTSRGTQSGMLPFACIACLSPEVDAYVGLPPWKVISSLLLRMGEEIGLGMPEDHHHLHAWHLKHVWEAPSFPCTNASGQLPGPKREWKSPTSVCYCTGAQLRLIPPSNVTTSHVTLGSMTMVGQEHSKGARIGCSSPPVY